MYHLFLQHVCSAAEAYRKLQMLVAEGFLLDFDGSNVQRISLVVLALGPNCSHHGKCACGTFG